MLWKPLWTTTTASGLAHAYPATNHDLFEQVTRRGLLVAEYPPLNPPTRERFLHRNRIIAARRDGGGGPEAGIRSGPLNAGGWANQLDMPAFALPTPTPTAPAWAGCTAMVDGGPRLPGHRHWATAGHARGRGLNLSPTERDRR